MCGKKAFAKNDKGRTEVHKGTDYNPIIPLIKLDSNESPLGPSPEAIAAMQAATKSANRYPDNGAGELRRQLCEIHSIGSDQVFVTAGLTEFLILLCRACLLPGRNAITSERSFVVYAMAAKLAGAQLIETPMRNHGFDLSAIAAAINESTRLVLLANPNNPTGTVFDAAALDRFLADVPDRVIVVLDEAYFDYASHFARLRGVEYSRSISYVRENRNVLVLRTFSKAHGLAGVRVAYALGQPELLKNIGGFRPTFSISTVAQAGAVAALNDHAHVQRALDNNASGAEWLAGRLAELGYPVPQPWANFVYCDIHQNADTFAARLAEEGVLVRPLGAWGAPTAIRVTIGTPEENTIFVDRFRKAGTQA